MGIDALLNETNIAVWKGVKWWCEINKFRGNLRHYLTQGSIIVKVYMITEIPRYLAQIGAPPECGYLKKARADEQRVIF